MSTEVQAVVRAGESDLPIRKFPYIWVHCKISCPKLQVALSLIVQLKTRNLTWLVHIGYLTYFSITFVNPNFARWPGLPTIECNYIRSNSLIGSSNPLENQEIITLFTLYLWCHFMIRLILHTLSDPIIFCPAFSSLQIFKLQHQMTSTTRQLHH
jgi:hypothetical protein